MTIEIFRLILDLFSMTGVIFIVIVTLLSIKKAFQQISHLHDLCDSLAMGSRPIVHRIYDRVKKMGPKKLSKEEWHNISREIYLSDYKQIKSRLEEAKKEAPPEEVQTIEKNQRLLDEIIMLLETTGPDTSTEHYEKIMSEIINTLKRAQQP